MSGLREQILGRIAGANARDSKKPVSLADQPADVQARLNNPQRHTLPKVADDATAQLIERMESVQMSVVRLQTSSEIVSAVEWYLESMGIDGSVTVSPALQGHPWSETVRAGAATGDELTSVTPCLAAVAETGSVVMASGEKTPATLNFLPENHIVVVYESQVVSHVDDVFPLLRALQSPPRVLNFVTGPSRTGDIEQTIEIGAHGPRRMHVLLVASDQ
ncbi:MAG: lactate utilization protein [Granulosicoccus sp.]